jgi:hypothetical protein
MLQAGRSRDRVPMRSLICDLIYLILQAALDPGFYSDSNRNKYPIQEKNIFVGHSRRLRLKTSLPSVSRSSRQCAVFNISQRYTLPRPITGIPLLFCLHTSIYNNNHHLYHLQLQ